MPGLARRILVCAADNGLVLQPVSSRKDQRPVPSVKLGYGDAAVSSFARDVAVESGTTKPAASFEAFGIVGLITVSKFTYLISITKRQQVAVLRGSPVYVVTEVALTPCTSYGEALVSVQGTAQHLKRRPTRDSDAGAEDDDDDDNDDDDRGSDSDDDDDALWPDDIGDDHSLRESDSQPAANSVSTATAKGHKPSGSIAEDVISRRGSYGRFAQRWFSRSGWLQEQKRLMGLTGDAKPVVPSSEDAVKAETAETTTTTTTTTAGSQTDASPSEPTGLPTDTPLPSTSADASIAAAAAASADATVSDTVQSAPSTPPVQENNNSSNSTEDSAAVSLLPKLLRTTQMLFGASRAFYFSYDYDITRSLVKQPKPRWTNLPLHKLVDPLYFWNRNVLQPLIDAGADALALPLMQGFVGQCSFVMDSHPPQIDDGAKESVELRNFSYMASGISVSPPQVMSGRTSLDAERRPSEKQFDLTLISRRSVKRAGLRYLRRGVDEDGHVANAVETEQILSPSVVDPQPNDPQSTASPTQSSSSSSPPPPARTCSFVQMRGSIPLFWTQSPFSLKPVPVIQHSLELNYVALKKHFDGLRREYGDLQIVNLVEKHGVEAALGTQYERSVQRYNDESKERAGPDQAAAIPFEWFDFHSACKGMKFENVSLLMDQLSRTIEQLGSTVEEGGPGNGTPSRGASGSGTVSPTDVSESNGYNAGTIVRKQQGVLRTNCMDCLDRTNVCQSSFAKFMLDAQLKEQGFDMTLQRDQENAWFNTLWADNGDAVSKQYASTAAMKGDYTRTRKRDYRGALTDAGLSLTRFFNGIVNDFFLQTTIDFLLGNVTEKIFDEFEANMVTEDPAMSMQKMREQAIDLCQRRVVADESEEFVGGWTLLAPHDADVSLTAPPFEEVVLLLTDAALYLCRFDWNLDKLSSFERVELAHIDKITLGTYIVSTVSPMQMDAVRNVGFVVSYRPGRHDVLRINTRSLSSIHPADDETGGNIHNATTAATTGDALSFSLARFLSRRPASPPAKRIAFKALYADTSLATSAAAAANEHGVKRTEKEQVVSIASEIERLVFASRPVAAGTERKSLLVNGDIVSLAEARRSTGLLGHLEHSLKKLVWA
ncbi:phosphoinositide phosphatase [Niveomyces insectorum RCEF 264]|uniref:Phosphoinositide phosphatase n=1 Tax=Niveomyces insectorum RCEF 264 TaxID=1081102 RepID=A0A167S0B9_9HYPO|nr:phosphoinositide phosphatase [Niveomyces insectorum RCEF 264]